MTSPNTSANNSASDWTIGIDNSDSMPVTIDSIPVTIDSSGSINFSNTGNNGISAPDFTFSNDSDTGFWRTSSNTVSFSHGLVINGITVSHDVVRDYLENAYIANKITKADLIKHLSSFYNDDGLSVAENLEMIELAKEKLIKEILEHERTSTA